MAQPFWTSVVGFTLAAVILLAILIGLTFVVDRSSRYSRPRRRDVERDFRTAWSDAQVHPLATDVAEVTALLSTHWLANDRVVFVAGRRRVRLNPWGTKLTVSLLARRGRGARSAYRLLQAARLSRPEVAAQGGLDTAPASLSPRARRARRIADDSNALAVSLVADDPDSVQAFVSEARLHSRPVVIEFSGSAATLSALGAGAILGLLVAPRERLNSVDAALNVDDMRLGLGTRQAPPTSGKTSADWEPPLPDAY